MGIERYEDPAPRRAFRLGGARRGRRGKALAEMSAAEVRRAMRMVPWGMAASVLILEARIAVLAIQEVMALWLAVVLAVGFAGWSTLMVIRTRQRYRVRLDQLCATRPRARCPSPRSPSP